MSNQPLTYEGVLEFFRKTRREMQRDRREMQRERQESSRKADLEMQEIRRAMQDSRAEFDRRMQEADRRAQEDKQERKERDAEFNLRMDRATKNVEGLTSSIGRLVENMVAGNIEEKFQVFGYEVMDCARNFKFGSRRLGTRGEIDLYLIDGDVEILIEVKTTLEAADVRKHIERMEKFRRHVDGKGKNTKRFIGAVAGATVDEEAKDIAHENGMYVIVQSGEAVEILPVPDDFQAKEW